MKCKECRDLVLALPGRPLPQPEMSGIRAAPARLPGLRRASSWTWKRSAALLRRAAGPLPVADSERSWQKDRRRGRARAAAARQFAAWLRFPRWALVAAGFLAFFILGVAVARLDFFPAKAPYGLAAPRAPSPVPPGTISPSCSRSWPSTAMPWSAERRRRSTRPRVRAAAERSLPPDAAGRRIPGTTPCGACWTTSSWSCSKWPTWTVRARRTSAS